MGTESFSRGVKRPWRGGDHSPSSSAEVKETVELHSLSGPSRPVLGRNLLSCELCNPYVVLFIIHFV